jgi:hypothetical protein
MKSSLIRTTSSKGLRILVSIQAHSGADAKKQGTARRAVEQGRYVRLTMIREARRGAAHGEVVVDLEVAGARRVGHHGHHGHRGHDPIAIVDHLAVNRDSN